MGGDGAAAGFTAHHDSTVFPPAQAASLQGSGKQTAECDKIDKNCLALSRLLLYNLLIPIWPLRAGGNTIGSGECSPLETVKR